MPHRKLIKDRDASFEIDAITRVIKNMTPSKITLMQYDHDSERFTFKLPKVIEGHDMMECNKVEVHYINGENPGVYTVTDLQVDTEDESKVKCSWLLSQNATKEKGSLRFSLRFSCVGDDGTIVYAWNSAIFQGISITEGLYNSEVIVEQYADVLEQWKKELEESGGSGGGGGAVSSVNGKTGAVVLTASDLDVYTKIEHEEAVSRVINGIVLPEIAKKADKADVFTQDQAMNYTDSTIINHYNGVVEPKLDEKADKNDVYTKEEVDSITGNIETALDSIIAIQNELLGV